MLQTIENLDLHAAHSCNLACESCSHFSNQRHKGLLSIDDAHSWMEPWQSRLLPEVFSILGGEPTMNPELCSIFRLTRKYWPLSMIRIITNGFFLSKHPDLPRVLRDDRDGWLFLSVHHDSAFYLERIRPVADLLADWKVRYGVRIVLFHSFEDWTLRYRGVGSSMEPFEDEDRRSSWDNCPARFRPQLFEGRIWKCAPVAYLRLQDEKYKLSSRWKPYLRYRLLEPTCSDEQLRHFFAREDEFYCTMCPANPVQIQLPLPLRNQPRQKPALNTYPGSGRSHSVLQRLKAVCISDPRYRAV